MIGAIIQARMSSTRLPGKTLKEVAGRPLLSYLIERLRLCQKIDKVVVATSIDSSDDAIELFCQKMKVEIYRGSLEDVLERYYQAATKANFLDIVRITGDCPLIEPGFCDRLIQFYVEQHLDYASLSQDFPEGLDCEIISYKALATSMQEARLRSEREHVTLYVRNHPEIFKMAKLAHSSDQGRYRVTVDNEEDFEVVSGIIKGMVSSDGKFLATWPQIQEFLDQHPALMAKNAHIERNEGLKKSLSKEGLA